MSAEVNYNAVAAYERSSAPQKQRNVTHVYTALLLAVFFIVLLAGSAVAVAMYQAVANNQLETNAARMQAGLLVSNVHVNDTMNAIGTGNGPEGRALVLTEHAEDGGAYEMRIYLYKGNVVQEYSLAGSAYTPERAQPLVSSSTFDFTLRDNLLILSTDQGATDIALRSYQGGNA